MKRVVVALCTASIFAACGGGKEGGTTSPPTAVATVELSQTSATIKVGDIIGLTAVAKSSSGQVLTGRTQSWTSSHPNIATVVEGAVSGVTPGVATITVTIDKQTAAAAITVELPGVASVQVEAPRKGFVRVGGTSQLSVVLRDASGTVQTRPITWSSSDQGKATVDGNGLVTGIAPGSVVITATSEGKSGSVTLTTTNIPEPTIAGITPATLTPGISATITGTNFSATPSEDLVTIAGVPAVVTSASATQLTVTVPADMPCVATRSHPVVVTTGGGPVEQQHPLRVAMQRTLSVGQSLVLSDAGQVPCNELSVTGGQYVVSVYTNSVTPSSRIGFELRGNGAAGVSLAKLPLPLPAFSRTSVLPPEIAELARLRAEGWRIHRAMMEQDRQLFRRFARSAAARRRFAPSRSLSGVGSTTASSAAPVPTTVGAMTTLRIRKPTDASCTAYDTVRARVVFVGSKSIVLEDSTAPLAKTIDAELAEIGQSFDDVMFPILTANFGNPLAYDASTDGNQKILMLFTMQVNNRAAGLLGFVTLCDFFPAKDFPASNQAEIFYARVPTSTGTNRFNFNHLTGWRGFMKGTVIHEAKHIVSFAERMATPIETDSEESWLEEGMAQVATELYARQIYGTSWKSNTAYGASVAQDIFAPGGQFLMADHFIEVYDYLADIGSLSYLTTEDVTVYGSAWMFARWLTDQYATDEGAFLRALTQEYTRYGVDNVESKVGKPFAELQGNFALTLAADDIAGVTPPPGARYTLPSWNTPTMFAGFAHDLQGFTAVPLVMRGLDFGDFSETVSELRSGSASYFLLHGTQNQPQLLDLRASGGVRLTTDSPLRMAILRVQ